jgi:rare lipoprotein A
MNLIRCTVALGFIALVAFEALADGAARVNSQNARFSQVGRATYYHKSLHGHRTASGERFNAQAMTAAHRRLKLGSYVRVTNLRNQRSVVVRINDRLPPRSQAIIDLSPKAARQLGMFHHGVAKVRLETISKEEFMIQTNPR